MTAFDKLLSYLDLREHNEKEIKDKLLSKGYSEEEVFSAIAKAKERGVLSEERYAESFIHSRLRNNPEGRTIILMRLLQKGCDKTIAQDKLSLFWENEEYLEPLSELYKKLEKKYGEDKTKEKLYKKGFTRSEIIKALETVNE